MYLPVSSPESPPFPPQPVIVIVSAAALDKVREMRDDILLLIGVIHEDGQVCAEHCDVFAAGLNLEGHILKDEPLNPGDPVGAHGIRRGDLNKLHAQPFAFFFEPVAALGQQGD